jgi:pyrroloquinoline quinone biosynthesis protein D
LAEPSALQPDDIVVIARHFRLQWEEVQQAYVLLYPEGMIKLNEAAGEILKRCIGDRSIAQIVTDLQQEFPEDDIEADVREFLEVAYANGWISIKRAH